VVFKDEFYILYFSFKYRANLIVSLRVQRTTGFSLWPTDWIF